MSSLLPLQPTSHSWSQPRLWVVLSTSWFQVLLSQLAKPQPWVSPAALPSYPRLEGLLEKTTQQRRSCHWTFSLQLPPSPVHLPSCALVSCLPSSHPRPPSMPCPPAVLEDSCYPDPSELHSTDPTAHKRSLHQVSSATSSPACPWDLFSPAFLCEWNHYTFTQLPTPPIQVSSSPINHIITVYWKLTMNQCSSSIPINWFNHHNDLRCKCYYSPQITDWKNKKKLEAQRRYITGLLDSILVKARPGRRACHSSSRVHTRNHDAILPWPPGYLTNLSPPFHPCSPPFLM